MVYGKRRREMSCPSVYKKNLGQCLHKNEFIEHPTALIQDQNAFKTLNYEKCIR